MTIKGGRKGSGEAKQLAAMLRKLADLVERSSTVEVDGLLSGRMELQIRETAPRVKGPTQRRLNTDSDVSYGDVAAKLAAFQSRDLGMELLRNEFSTKTSLEKLARYLDLPVLRTDTIDSLCEKIVESEIGSRLRSEAVQGKKPR